MNFFLLVHFAKMICEEGMNSVEGNTKMLSYHSVRT